MRITKRIPLEAYAYEEIEFDSLEEYKEMYPKYVQTMKQLRKQIKQQNDVPFEGDEYAN